MDTDGPANIDNASDSINSNGENEKTSPSREAIKYLDRIDAPFSHLETRLRAFLRLSNRRKLWKGRYEEAGYPDRSRAEGALVYHLGWFFDANKEVISELMDLACELYPETDHGEKRKWLERTDDAYRKSTLQLPDFDSTYSPKSRWPNPRPEVSDVTLDMVLFALLRIEPATYQEISRHQVVDVGEEQTRKTLKELISREIVNREKDRKRPGNPYVYYSL